jgi:hypothetical protein
MSTQRHPKQGLELELVLERDEEQATDSEAPDANQAGAELLALLCANAEPPTESAGTAEGATSDERGPSAASDEAPHLEVETLADGKRVILSADREIVLRCGKASITLTRSGKIILKGTHLVSHATGVNRIRGGAVEIN